MVKTPDYILEEKFVYSSNYSSHTLEAGYFVRPINYIYVPKHIIERPEWKYFNCDKDVFCYTRIGIVAIPKKLLRKV